MRRLTEKVTVHSTRPIVQTSCPVTARAAEVEFHMVNTEGRLPLLARLALTAAANRKHHMVTRLETRDSGADLIDDTGALMSEHHRKRSRQVTVTYIEIRPADAGGDDFHSHFAVSRFVKIQRTNCQSLLFLLCHCGKNFHGLFTCRLSGYR
ncbi:hypothetical protein PCL1606_21950 [Pseudomonas chlororaphis]|uniref:Uncharacterized protein n=1 Tax=Pseudomonas chlororaphis TaxID=587753 RepID=A0A0D5XX44_9PSED|nr:hypothetical protein PCL1606_21950 [Pseudomonas chlororaphis]